MDKGNESRRDGLGKHRVSVLVLNQAGGWVSEVAIRCDGRLKAYRRHTEVVHPSQDAARLAGYQWAEDFLRALTGREAPAPAGGEHRAAKEIGPGM